MAPLSENFQFSDKEASQRDMFGPEGEADVTANMVINPNSGPSRQGDVASSAAVPRNDRCPYEKKLYEIMRKLDTLSNHLMNQTEKCMEVRSSKNIETFIIMATTSKLVPEVITTTKRCDEVIQDILSSGQHVAVDAEGVNLGKTGPLTLLQIGTESGAVYLFDIVTNKSLLTSGSLKELLESEKIAKIMHSCRGDSAALYHQFNVTLENIFDTQIAHIVIREGEGNRTYRAEKLVVISDVYGKHSSMLERKEDIQKRCIMVAGYWAQRPLQQEMIDYAAGDVLVLFSIHKRQVEILDEKNLQARFKDMVTEEIFGDIKADVREVRQGRLIESVKAINAEINEKCNTGQCSRLSQLNEEEIWALDCCRTDEISDFSPIFINLRRQRFIQFLSETREKINEDPSAYEVPHYMFAKLKSNELFYKGTEAGFKAGSLKALIMTVQGDNIKRKFKANTPLEYIKNADKNYIRYIPLANERNPAILALYERIVYNDMDEIRKNLEEEPNNFKISQAQRNTIRFLARRARCSADLKGLCKGLLTKVNQR